MMHLFVRLKSANLLTKLLVWVLCTGLFGWEHPKVHAYCLYCLYLRCQSAPN